MGGETVFYPRDRRSPDEEIAVQLETGLLLLHKHGDDCLLVCGHSPFSPTSPGSILNAAMAEEGKRAIPCTDIFMISTARRPRGSRRREVGSPYRPLH